MNRQALIFLLIFPVLIWKCTPGNRNQENEPRFWICETYNQVHVIRDNQHFATYLFDTAWLKPVLYPVHSPSGILVQRKYPFSIEQGESHDHPHHAGLFFTYGTEGEVNGNNFWANQQGLTKIRHTGYSYRIDSGKVILNTRADWIKTNGQVMLEEERVMVFSGDETKNMIDFTIHLKAISEDVHFGDTKEGMFGIRVADWLSESQGRGMYLNSRSDTTEAGVWGKRAEWVRLAGSFEGKPINLIIMNHPASINFPTYWHARGYGLFAANPLGESVFEAGRGAENPEPLNYVIEAGESGLFKFRLIIHEGDIRADQIEAAFKEYGN